MAANASSKLAVHAALAGNILVALTKAFASFWTGSSSMLSEAIHSVVDCGNEALLLYGMHRAGRRPDAGHPLGYGRELYFWSFIVAVLIFALGAGVSFYEGLRHLQEPEPIVDPVVNYIVLALSLLFEAGSWLVSFRQFRAAKGELGFLEAFRRSKDPPSFIVLFEDSAALIGILVAALATFLAVRLEAPAFDALGSIVIGLLLAFVAAVLARESKSLLIGERADPALDAAILAIAADSPGIAGANGLVTVHLSPDQILAALSLEFADERSTTEIEEIVAAVEARIRASHPEVAVLFVKPQARQQFIEAVQRRYGDPDRA